VASSITAEMISKTNRSIQTRPSAPLRAQARPASPRPPAGQPNGEQAGAGGPGGRGRDWPKPDPVGPGKKLCGQSGLSQGTQRSRIRSGIRGGHAALFSGMPAGGCGRSGVRRLQQLSVARARGAAHAAHTPPPAAAAKSTAHRWHRAAALGVAHGALCECVWAGARGPAGAAGQRGSDQRAPQKMCRRHCHRHPQKPRPWLCARCCAHSVTTCRPSGPAWARGSPPASPCTVRARRWPLALVGPRPPPGVAHVAHTRSRPPPPSCSRHRRLQWRGGERGIRLPPGEGAERARASPSTPAPSCGERRRCMTPLSSSHPAPIAPQIRHSSASAQQDIACID